MQVNNGRMAQETYQTGDSVIKKRVKELRRQGYKVITDSMGMQVTPLGLMKMTLITILPGEHLDTLDIGKIDYPI
jgi:hypothetical protein